MTTYNVKVNHEDLGEFESAEKLWQAIGEYDLAKVNDDTLADWEDIDDSSVPTLLKEAKDQGFIDDYDLEEIPDREPLEDYLGDALEYPEQAGDKLTSWVDWVGGDDTAANMLEEEHYDEI